MDSALPPGPAAAPPRAPRPGGRRFVAAAAGALALLTSVPYLLARLPRFADSRPLGQLGFETDMNAYFAFIRQSADGAWLFRNPFTPEPHGAALFNLEWLFAGKVAALCGGALQVGFQAERLVGVVVLVAALHALCRRLMPGARSAAVTTVAVLVGGGFGWLTAFRGLRRSLATIQFLDLRAGVHPFLWTLLQPHFLIAQALAVTCLATLLRAEETRARRDYLLAGAACLAAGACRPFDMLYLWTATGLFVLVGLARRDGLRAAVDRSLVVAVSAPLMLYYVWVFRVHPVFQWWGIQNELGPPPVLGLALSLGLAAFLAPVGLARVAAGRFRHAPATLLACCAVASLGLVYSYPLLTFTLQVATTTLVPLALLAAWGLAPLLARPGRAAAIATAVLVLLNAPTSAVVANRVVREVLRGEHRVEDARLEAYARLAELSGPDDVVLAGFADANRLPRYTARTVYCGYLFATVEYQRKMQEVTAFFTAWPPARRAAFLEQHGIRWLLVDPRDPQVRGFDPGGDPALRVRYANDRVAVVERVAP